MMGPDVEPKVRWVGQTAAMALPHLLLLTTTAFAQSDQTGLRQQQTTVMFAVLAVVFVIGVLILFLPAYIAFRRQHPNKWAIAVVCLAFGGTIIGWFGALIWALHAVHQSPDGTRGGESGLNIFGNDPVNVRVEPTASAVPAAGFDDITGGLERLKGLLDAGVLTDDEYAALKAGLLAKL